MDIINKLKIELSVVKYEYFIPFIVINTLARLFIKPSEDILTVIFLLFFSLYLLWYTNITIKDTPLHFTLFLIIVVGVNYLPYIG